MSNSASNNVPRVLATLESIKAMAERVKGPFIMWPMLGAILRQALLRGRVWQRTAADTTMLLEPC